MISGLTIHATMYPEPPITPTAMTPILGALTSAQSALVEARSAYESAVIAKDEALMTLVEALKKDIRYAENTVNYENDKLALIGWGGRKLPTPTTAPGQARLLTVTQQGEGALTLAWLVPAEGGKVTSYTIQRRLRTETAWTQIASTYERTISLTNQTRGAELEYSVIATNKAGDGPISNTVQVVL
jgi:hypothetical protein